MATQISYTALIETGGTSTLMTSEACSLVSGTIYQITNAAKRVIDPAVSVSVFDGVTGLVDADVTIDYLFGKITLANAPGGAVTVTANYIPRWSVASPREFEINCVRTALDSTAMATATANRARMLGLKTARGSVGHIDRNDTDVDTSGAVVSVNSMLAAGVAVLLSIALGDGFTFRGWVLLEAVKQGASIDDLITGSFNWSSHNIAGLGDGASDNVNFGFSA